MEKVDTVFQGVWTLGSRQWTPRGLLTSRTARGDLEGQRATRIEAGGKRDSTGRGTAQITFLDKKER